MKMIINDKIYGKEEISEEVLNQLIYSPGIQRLKDISQFGVPDKYNFKKGYSRFEHSLGVFILLRNLGANLEEQVAGLLHDVSHTAFSHVIDWVFGDPIKEDYQDKIHFKVIKNSEIPKILSKYGLNYEEISQIENFPLLEREMPGLCADRIDYSLREIFNYDWGLSKTIFKNLLVKNRQIVFQDKNIAEVFARNYIDLQSKHWAGDKARTRYYILSEALREGLNKKIIYLDDLNKTDYYVLNLLENSNNRFILDSLNLLKNGFDILESETGIELKKKFRYVDPEVLVNGSYKNLSSLSKEYFKILEFEKEKSKLVKKIKIIPK